MNALDNVDMGQWIAKAEEFAMNDWARTLSLPGVMDAILEEYNNDLCDYFSEDA